MAGVLEYFLSLKTSGFDGPMRQSQAGLERFDRAAVGGTSKLGGFAAAATGATVVVAGFAGALALANANLENYAAYDGLVRGLRTIEGTAEATTRRIAQMREVAKVPGLGFEEAVQGDIRLRSVGFTAALSERSMRAFGNAIATVGGGKAQLDGVLLALTQIQAKGKVSAEEINQISERVPQVRAAMAAAFGTADTEALGRSTLTTTQFVEGLVAELEKLPQVTSGARNALDNYTDAWKEVKTAANEFTVGISADLLDGVSGVLKQASRDLNALKNLLGIKTPGLEGPDGQSGAAKEREAEEFAVAEAAAAANALAVQAHNDRVQAEEDAFVAAEQRKREEAAKSARERAEQEKRASEIIDRMAQTTLSREEYLARKIAALRAEGATGADAVNNAGSAAAKLAVLERTERLLALEKELETLREQEGEKAKSTADLAERKAEGAAQEATARREAVKQFELENQILAARAAGNTQLVRELEEQAKLERLKLDIMRQQGLAEEDATRKARERLALENAGTEGRRGVLDAAASQAARNARRSAADVAKDARRGAGEGSVTDRLALADLERRRARLSPTAAAAELAGAGAGADPGKVRRDERAEAARKPAETMLQVVKAIDEKLSNLTSA